MSNMAEATVYDSPGMESPQAASRLWVEFYVEAEQDLEESTKAGRPVHVDREYIRIRIPGDKDNDVARPVRAYDKQIFAQQYAAFKAGLEQPVTGTPISSLPFLTKAQVADFHAMNVKTAEQIRDMPDSVAQKFMGINAIRKRVSDFLVAAEGQAGASKLQEELQKRDNEIEALKKMVRDLAPQPKKG